MVERKKVGLALSGGGMKGLAHIGVLKVLEKYKIPIDMISGTSMGALIGSLYACQPNAKKLEHDVLSENIEKLLDYTLSSHGIIKGNKIEEFLRVRMNNITFDKLKIPTFITAFDLDKKREVIYSRGDVTQAVRASISIPGIFIPVENNNEIIVDAGLVDPVPTEVLRKNGADIIIAVNVSGYREKPTLYNQKAKKQRVNKRMPSMINATLKSISIMGAELAHADIKRSKIDFVIDVNLEGIELFDYKKAGKIIKKGEATAKASLKKIINITEPHPFTDFLAELGFKGIASKVKDTIAQSKIDEVKKNEGI